MDEETKIFPDLFSLGNEMNMRWNETWKGFTQHHMGESPEPGIRLLSLPAVSPAAERQHDGRAEGLEWEMGKNLTPLLAESLWARLPCLVINTVWAFPGNHTNVRVVRKFKVRSWMQKHLAHLLPPPPAWKEVSECHHQPNYWASPLSDARLTERLPYTRHCAESST